MLSPRSFFVGGLMLSCLVLVSTVSAQAVTCQDVMSRPPMARSAVWREAITQRAVVPLQTNRTIEAEVRRFVRGVESSVINDSATTQIDMFFEDSVAVTSLRDGGDYGTGIYPKYGVSSLGPSGRATFLLGLPVSGHLGEAQARQWALNDTYNVRIEKQSGSGGFTTVELISRQRSLGITTIHEVNFTFEKNVLYRFSYWRDGSAGPHGYPEGRFIELIWDGN